MDEKRQVQRELFEEFGSVEKPKYPKNAFQNKPKPTVTLSYEHIIFVIIGVIILSIIVFSLGVERGKRIVFRNKLFSTDDINSDERFKSAKEYDDIDTAEGQEVKPPAAAEDKQEEAAEDIILPYTVQVASYKSNAAAESRAEDLKLEGYEAFTMEKGEYYIMCIGRFADKADAAAENKRLRKRYSDCFVRKIS